MTRGYLNSFSFPATDVEASLELMVELRRGIGRLIAGKAIAPQIMGALRAAQMPLSPDYVTLPVVARTAAGRFRDTILFFLQVLDQRSPVHAALPAADQEEARPSVVDAATCDFDPEAATVLVACALDQGVLLSLGSNERWRCSVVEITMLTATAENERIVALLNVHDTNTAGAVTEAQASARARHRFENWDHLTGEARRSPQVDAWFEECRSRPGLEQLIMRSVAMAHSAGWLPDGDLVKKLNANTHVAVLEVRAYYNGSNNVRLLFGRSAGGTIAVGFGGIKTAPDWYAQAIPHAERFIREQ